MNPRERTLAIILVSIVIIFGGGFLGYRFYYVPREDRQRTLKRLKDEADKKTERRDQILADRPKLAGWRQLSLPADPVVARREYEKYLSDLLVDCGIAPTKFTVTPRPIDPKSSPTIAGKGPIYTKLIFSVQVYATLGTTVRILEEFYHTGLLHQIKKLNLQRQLTINQQARADELDVRLDVEALIVAGTYNRSWLLPNVDRFLLSLDTFAALRQGPSGLGLAFWAMGPAGPLGPELLATPARSYEAIARKNVFLGRQQTAVAESTPEWMAPRFVFLTDITQNWRRTEGSLYDRLNNRPRPLRATFPANTFPFIRDADGNQVVQGLVVKIEDREVLYRVGLFAQEAAEEESTGRAGFFRLSKKEIEPLLADKSITAEEEEGLFRVDRSYWETLEKDRVIRTDRDGGFRITLERANDRPSDNPEMGSAIEILRGRIVQRDGTDLIIKAKERYHSLRIGGNVEESLRKELPEELVKEFKVASRGG